MVVVFMGQFLWMIEYYSSTIYFYYYITNLIMPFIIASSVHMSQEFWWTVFISSLSFLGNIGLLLITPFIEFISTLEYPSTKISTITALVYQSTNVTTILPRLVYPSTTVATFYSTLVYPSTTVSTVFSTLVYPSTTVTTIKPTPYCTRPWTNSIMFPATWILLPYIKYHPMFVECSIDPCIRNSDNIDKNSVQNRNHHYFAISRTVI
jgi:hypothetical protein